MEITITKWNLRKLIRVYSEGNLNLNPPYQRNDIWSSKAKSHLIDSILNNYPLPNIILHDRGAGKFDMVDGQQRSRTILGFNNGIIKSDDGSKFDNDNKSRFLNYNIPVVVVSHLNGAENIEEV